MYTPPDGENGNVAITYSVVNSCRLRASGRVTIDVNQEPVGAPKSIKVFRAEPVVVPVTDLATDAEALTITSMTGAPTWVTREANRLVIGPTLSTVLGVSSFTVTVIDPGGLSTVVPVTVTVQNRIPVANGDTIDVTDGEPRVVDLVANDTDTDSSGDLVISELLASTLHVLGRWDRHRHVAVRQPTCPCRSR